MSADLSSSPPHPVVIITGAGSGIGRATAIDLSSRGCRIVLNGRRQAALEETAQALTAPWSIVAGDIADPQTAERLIDDAIESFGRLDAVVSNAGIAPCTPIEKHTPAIIREVFEINALGPAFLFVAAWKQFQAQNALDNAAGRGPGDTPASSNTGGCLVLVSSMATIDPFPGLFAYAAAKSALNSMARSARAEAKDLGIRCFVVAPGAVETPMLRAIVDTDLLPKDRALPPESVAVVIAECIAGLRDEQVWETIVVPSP
jgi:NAD(P)-dependent dehydrogenase (short-subunit alcohol dehydrogenase family)